MSVGSATRRGRRAAEAIRTDVCTITRGSGGQVFDPDTGTYVTTPGELVYTGPCRVKPTGADRVVEAGGEAVSLFPYVVSVPVNAVQYAVDDVVTVTAALSDPALVGLVLRVKLVPAGSSLTARRLGCERDAG